MTTVTREHKAGLELALDEMRDMLPGDCESRLNRLIAQASSAPEQEAALYLRHIEGAGTDWTEVKELAEKWLDEGYRVQTFYTHPSAEIERLRAEVERLYMQLTACGVVAMANTHQSAAEARDMHPDYNSVACRDVMRAVDREINLRDQLAEAQELLRRVQRHGPANVQVGLDGDIDAFLSATAQPAVEQSAGVDDGTCPECEGADLGIYGPCRECGGVGTFEAALRRNHSAEDQNDE